jgi:hypothetical protein
MSGAPPRQPPPSPPGPCVGTRQVRERSLPPDPYPTGPAPLSTKPFHSLQKYRASRDCRAMQAGQTRLRRKKTQRRQVQRAPRRLFPLAAIARSSLARESSAGLSNADRVERSGRHLVIHVDETHQPGPFTHGVGQDEVKDRRIEAYPPPTTFSFGLQSIVKVLPGPGEIRIALVLVETMPAAVLAGPRMLAT